MSNIQNTINKQSLQQIYDYEKHSHSFLENDNLADMQEQMLLKPQSHPIQVKKPSLIPKMAAPRLLTEISKVATHDF